MASSWPQVGAKLTKLALVVCLHENGRSEQSLDAFCRFDGQGTENHRGPVPHVTNCPSPRARHEMHLHLLRRTRHELYPLIMMHICFLLYCYSFARPLQTLLAPRMAQSFANRPKITLKIYIKVKSIFETKFKQNFGPREPWSKVPKQCSYNGPK